jgi:hypothetical protein
MASASLVLGIISISLSVLCFCGPFVGQAAPFICGALAVVFGILGQKKQPEKANQAKAGMVMGIIGLAVSVLIMVFWTVILASGGDINKQLKDPFNWKSLVPKDL